LVDKPTREGGSVRILRGSVRTVLTDALDVLGVLAVAAGVGAGVATWLGWWGLAVAGGVLLAGSALAERMGGGGR
jgi:hypothetical protein